VDAEINIDIERGEVCRGGQGFCERLKMDTFLNWKAQYEL